MIKNGKMSKEERDFYREMIDNYVLKEHYERVKDEKLELQQRIDKAIEYIEKQWYSINTTNINDIVSLGNWKLDLLSILRGEDNE